MKALRANPVKGIESIKRRGISVSEATPIRAEPLVPGRNLARIIAPITDGVDLIAWASGNKAMIESELLKHGAVLFRGFEFDPTSGFELFIKAVAGDPLSYDDRVTPRSHVSDGIYTSTEYPADQSIELHNECSYAQSWPMKIFFHCVTAATSGGETPLADSRKVYERISPEIRNRFAQKNVMYTRSFGSGIGPRWQDVFGSADKEKVVKYCSDNNIEYQWHGEDRLTTRQIRAAVSPHPRTGEMVWFNQATAFHISTVQSEIGDLLVQELKDDLPKNAYYGDGAPIESEVLNEIRDAYRQEKFAFPWRRGDLLMLDNMLMAHGRAPFSGARKILVGMAEPFGWNS